MKIKYLFITLFLPSLLFAQEDEKAEEILDRMAEKNKSYETITAEFTIEFSNLQSEDYNRSKEGTIIIKGDKYKLDLNNSIVYYDGETMWNYLEKPNEVNISEASSESGEQQDILNHPNKIFELYKQDFKYKFIGNTTVNGRQVYEIDLFPRNLDEDYSRIRVKVLQENDIIYAAKVFGKDGARYNFTIDHMTTNESVPDSTFVFDESDYPDVEVIDMRF
ncbi:MAG: outer membrane lipoprotein carrier protein LolA [Bacteroidales bacterium]